MKQINTIKGYEEIRDWYFVTSCGRAISIRDGEIKVLKTRVNKGGYEQITFSNIEGRKKTCYIHRVVALAFIPNPENKPQVNHIDEVKTHNYVGNLEWTTIKENINYGNRNERAGKTLEGRVFAKATKQKMKEAKKGERNPKSKPIEYYEKNSTQRNNFKVTCKKRGWNFEDFIEVDSGEKCGNSKKYYYIKKLRRFRCYNDY